jgi:hypothetical protein
VFTVYTYTFKCGKIIIGIVYIFHHITTPKKINRHHSLCGERAANRIRTGDLSTTNAAIKSLMSVRERKNFPNG